MRITAIVLALLLSACAGNGEQRYSGLDHDVVAVEEFLQKAENCTKSGGRVVIPHRVGTRIRKPMTWEELTNAYCSY